MSFYKGIEFLPRVKEKNVVVFDVLLIVDEKEVPRECRTLCDVYHFINKVTEEKNSK